MVLAIAIYKISGAKKVHFNGPTPVPLLGNILTLKRLKADPDGELLRIRKKWGHICMLWFGTTPVILINHPRAAKELLNEVGHPSLILKLSG